MTISQWWSRGQPALRTRRRLLVLSAPIALVLVLAIVKIVSAIIAGNAAATAFADRDTEALRGAVDALNVVNVVEPAKASFAAGALAVLEDRLEDADREFSASLGRTDSCVTRVNLDFVQETLGDRAFAALDGEAALAWFVSARAVVEHAQVGCFADNHDDDPQRRALRNDAGPRLDAKINALRSAPPLPPPPPPPAAGAAPPPPPPSSASDTDADTSLRLNPGGGDPLDRLRQILQDAAARGGG